MAIQLPLFSGGLPALSVQPAGQKPPAVKRVTKGSRSAHAGTGTGNLAKGTDTADIAANARKHRVQEPRPGAPLPPAGPAPAFEISILEQQLDLKLALARSQAAHGQNRQMFQSAAARAQPDSPAGQARAGQVAGDDRAQENGPA